MVVASMAHQLALENMAQRARVRVHPIFHKICLDPDTYAAVRSVEAVRDVDLVPVVDIGFEQRSLSRGLVCALQRVRHQSCDRCDERLTMCALILAHVLRFTVHLLDGRERLIECFVVEPPNASACEARKFHSDMIPNCRLAVCVEAIAENEVVTQRPSAYSPGRRLRNGNDVPASVAAHDEILIDGSNVALVLVDKLRNQK